MVLTRQKVPTFDRTKLGSAKGLHRGAYVLAESNGPAKVIFIGTGSEVQLAIAAQEQLEKDGVPTRVVSMPCMEVFHAQDAAYRESVLPKAVKARVSVEAGVTFGWERFIGDHGVAVGVDRFGASAPDKILFEQYGLTASHVVAAAKQSLASL